ncbi:pilus assembly protein PilP [Facilibium subflavum]|uniref:pilus assembly protein PilP n=1 Tax=Facilibium subflavum TaxID=2219058 RepID=UPI0013C2BFAC|nr:pilus assembly protein PilP [Facilibium subflavum]
MFKRLYFLLFVLVFFVACTKPDNVKDLVQYTKQTLKNTPANPVPSLPEVAVYQIKEVSLDNLRNPFEHPKSLRKRQLQAQTRLKGEDMLKPDFTRKKTALENIPLKDLMFVGTLKQEGQFWAIINNVNNNHSFIVKPGQYLGQNYGKVIKITTQYIELDERVQDKHGKWEQRFIKLRLQNQNEI